MNVSRPCAVALAAAVILGVACSSPEPEPRATAEQTEDTVVSDASSAVPGLEQYRTSFDQCAYDRGRLITAAGTYNTTMAAEMHAAAVKGEPERTRAYEGCLDALNRAEWRYP